MKEITILSLFDGISCGQVALNRVEIPYSNYYASEVDKYAIQIAKKNYPTTIEIGDVTKIYYKDGVLTTENGTFKVGHINLLIGGSPCQSFTFAGKREGMVTEEDIEILTLEQYLDLKEQGFEFKGQSYLFWEYVRLLREINPDRFILENVKMVKHWRDIITSTLGVNPINLNSELVSAQSRKRVYWTNIPGVEQPEDRHITLQSILDSGTVDREKSLCIARRYAGFQGSQDYLRRRYFGKSMGQAAFEGCTPEYQRELWKADPRKVYKDQVGVIRPLTCEEVEKLQTMPVGYTKCIPERWRKEALGNGWTARSYCTYFVLHESSEGYSY